MEMDVLKPMGSKFITMLVEKFTDEVLNKKPKTVLKSMEGAWLEVIHDQPSRMYSLGYITYNRKDKKHHYCGINYHNDGTEYYYWNSVVLHVNSSNDRLFYIYKVINPNSKLNGGDHHGFGTILIRPKDDIEVYTPKTGYFLDASGDSAKKKWLNFYSPSEVSNHFDYKLNLDDQMNISNFIKMLADKNFKGF